MENAFKYFELAEHLIPDKWVLIDSKFERQMDTFEIYLMNFKREKKCSKSFTCGELLGDSTGFFWTDTIYNYCVINKAVFEKKKHTVYFEMRLLIKRNPFLGMFLIDFISKAENLIGEFKLNEDGSISLCHKFMYKSIDLSCSILKSIYKMMLWNMFGYKEAFEILVTGTPVDNFENKYKKLILLEREAFVEKKHCTINGGKLYVPFDEL